ncbi:MAG: hypothetical protein JST76_10965, partial [Bacteroidetes bacterium]|nr:hypothetical protein [Bacteroidota bacterium]
RNGIWSALVIAFVINVLSATISDYFEKYIIGFIQIFLFSIASAALPTLIQITCLLILAALVNWTAAAAFCMPIKLIAEEGYEKDEEETINDDPRIIE